MEADMASFEGSLQHGNFGLVSASACNPDLVGTFPIFRHLKVTSEGRCAGVHEKAHSGVHFARLAGFLFS